MPSCTYFFFLTIILWKDSLCRILFQGLFPPGQAATIGVDFMIKTVEIEGEKIKVTWSKCCKTLNRTKNEDFTDFFTKKKKDHNQFHIEGSKLAHFA